MLLTARCNKHHNLTDQLSYLKFVFPFPWFNQLLNVILLASGSFASSRMGINLRDDIVLSHTYTWGEIKSNFKNERKQLHGKYFDQY